MTNQIQIRDISDCLQQLPAVQALWRKNSKTLGMFPKGAFEEAASKNWIIVALDESSQQLAGYLLYRITRHNVAITHLCISTNHRNRGVAKQLFKRLATTTRSHSGIVVRCRQDFDARGMWPQLGFMHHGEKSGRSNDGGVLDIWWYAQDAPGLFTFSNNQAHEKLPAVAIDANVIYDFDREGVRAEGSRALLADWLEGTVTIVVTGEIFNEINRCPDPAQQSTSRQRAQSLTFMDCTGSAFDHWYDIVKKHYPDELNDRDRSDIRQLARAAGGGANFFLTWDQRIVDLASDIEQTTGLRIFNPADFITHIDELERDHVYHPARFLGSSIVSRGIRAEDADTLAKAVALPEESRKYLRSRIRRLVSSPIDNETVLVGPEGNPQACLITTTTDSSCRTIDVQLLRSARGAAESTYAQQIVRQLVRKAANQKVDAIRIDEEGLSTDVKASLFDNGFIELAGEWIKINLYGLMSREAASDRLREIASCIGLDGQEGGDEWAEYVADLKENDVVECTQQEHYLWPLKISDSSIPTYIVSIRPQWACELFDHRLTKIFHRRDDLAMNTEAVYYRSASGAPLEVPARILWYVSTHSYPGESFRIRACSYLDEFAVGSAKELFRRFRRLGIYGWPEVLETAKNDPYGELSALRFSRTELLPNCIVFDRFQELLNKPNQIQSPLKVTPEEFGRIYNEAITVE